MEQYNWAYSFGDRKNFFFETSVSKRSHDVRSHLSLFSFISGIVLKKALVSLFMWWSHKSTSIDSFVAILFGQTAEWEQTHG